MQRILPILFFAMLLTSCSVTKPVRDRTQFYILSPGEVEAVSDAPMSLRIERVRLPGYLEGNAMAARDEAAAIRYFPFHRWAGGFDGAFSQALAEALRGALPEASIQMRNDFAGTPGEQRLELRVYHFEGREDGSVRIEIDYALRAPSGDASPTRKRFSWRNDTWDGESHAQLASLLGEGIAAFAQEIARSATGQE